MGERDMSPSYIMRFLIYLIQTWLNMLGIPMVFFEV